jgi:hypothetical protein
VLAADALRISFCGLIHKLIFETKKLFALANVSVEINPMNKQTYALRVKLASMTDAKKIHALKLKIQQLKKSK